MPVTRDKTLTEFMIEEQRRSSGATGVFTSLLNGIRLTCKRISWLIGQGARGAAANAVGANETFLNTLEWGGYLGGMASAKMDAPYPIPALYPRGRYLLIFDPLDDASNIDVNVSTGSIFSVLRAPEGIDGIEEPTLHSFLQPGTVQVAAGYALYGPTTMLVFTVGRGVNAFTLDRGFGEFILTHAGLTIPESTREFAVNTSNARFWEPPVQRYVEECVQGQAGLRGADFNMRWIASLIAEVHRILIRGGVFLSPTDLRAEGGLRLLFEANPLAMLVEQAGGAASTGRGRILEVTPTSLQQRVPVFLGAREEVARVEAYHHEHDQGLEPAFSSPLFNRRSLFPGL